MVAADGCGDDSAPSQPAAGGGAGVIAIAIAGTGAGAEAGTTGRTPVCGDAVRDADEACDDGNTLDGDECSAGVDLSCGISVFEYERCLRMIQEQPCETIR